MAIVDLNYVNATLVDPAEKGMWAAYLSVQDTITAAAGGGQTNATPITSMNARVTTVASAADSVLLPKSSPGLFMSVTNAAAANSMNVFPSTGEAINALAANAAFAVAAGKCCIFIATKAGQWHSILSA